MLVKDVMHSPVFTLEPSASLEAAYAAMMKRRIRHVPVVETGRVVGVVTDRDLRLAASPFSPSGAKPLQTPIREVMSQPVVTGDPRDPVEDAARVMRQRKIGALPILDGAELVGIVTGIDLLDALLRLTGAEKPSGRIEVRLDDKPGQLARLTQLLAEQGINIHSVLTYPYDEGTICTVLRIGTLETRKLAKSLYDAKFEVLWPPVFKS
ncbi:MAG: CBS and ACT domain-containing protein [Meiothermus sp.]|nr:CBS and ACT domain-containing protein [Meiothermus sp.]